MRPELAAQVAYNRLSSDASFEVEAPGGRVRATQRRTGWSVLVYLDSTAEDVGLLRRAIATTAHEIRGPVAVLCGIAETMGWERDQLDDAQCERLMASVARQARLLDSITADLLTAAQIQRGTLRLDLQVVDPRTAVEAVVADRYDVDVSIEDDRCVRADPLRLEQMLTNLLSNAHKYGAAPYSVRIRPRRGPRRPRLLRRRGPRARSAAGVRRTALHASSPAPTTPIATGTGLGLYVVRTLAEAQKGVGRLPGRRRRRLGLHVLAAGRLSSAQRLRGRLRRLARRRR